MVKILPACLWALASFLLFVPPQPRSARVLEQVPFREVLPAKADEVRRVDVTDDTRVYLDGKRVKYDEVPPDAVVTGVRLKRDGRTAAVIEFECRGKK